MKENKELREQMTKRIGDVWQQLDHAQQQRVKSEVELQHTNQMLQDEVAKNQAIKKQLQESMDSLNREIICQERTIEELSSKGVQRLQRIRMLEAQTTIERTSHAMRSERINATLQEAGRNKVEIAVHGASLTGVSEGTKSFILLDFHSFASE
jgi:CRISPR/Cas system CMR subunit Cmr4 (Cas7 group RAMP superfamily)